MPVMARCARLTGGVQVCLDLRMTSPRQAAAPRSIPEWTFGERLRKIRRAVGAGQAEFADGLNENRKTYAAWELDKSSPRNVVAVARRVELMTGFPASWVLGLDQAEPARPAPETAAGANPSNWA